MQKKAYQIASNMDRRKIAECLSKDGQLLLPLLELICNTENAIDEVIDLVGRGAIEAILMLSAQQIAASEAELKRLCERRFDDANILVIYIDGIQFGDCHVIAALGVDSIGHKHVLGICEGSSENARVVSDLLNDLVERGVKADRLRLFIIDGSKALRCHQRRRHL